MTQSRGRRAPHRTSPRRLRRGDRRRRGRARRRRAVRRRPASSPPGTSRWRRATATSRTSARARRPGSASGPWSARLGLLRRPRPRRRRARRRRGRGRPPSRRRAAGCPGRPVDLVPVEPQVGSGPAGRGGPVRGVAGREGRPARGRDRDMHGAGADLAEALLQAWDTSTWFVSTRGRPDRPARPQVRRRHPADRRRRGRDAAPVVPRLPRAVRHPRLGAGHASSTCPATPSGSPRRRSALLTAPALPGHRDRPRARRRADGAADPRVGRPRDRARPDPRLGGGVRRDLVARPRPARVAAVRLGADDDHASTRPSPARSARSGTTTRGRPPPRATPSGTASGSASWPGATPAARRRAGLRRQRARRRLRPAADGPDDQRRPGAGPAHARRDDRRDRRRRSTWRTTGPGRSTTGG